MTAATLMIQGTTSGAGKSFLAAGLCRLFARRGIRVAPYKSQNMSNNAFVTAEGHEMGRAQAVQAMAADILPHVDMNPILLKPEPGLRSQVVVNGRVLGRMDFGAYQEQKPDLWPEAAAALDRLRERFDLVIIEGAGSPAEINLKDRDIANMRVARHAGSPVLVAGDIERGGVFAHLYGTHALLDPEEQALVKGFVINRMRGSAALLEPGLTGLERLTGVPVVGVVPWVPDHGIPEEDAVAIEGRRDGAGATELLDVAVVALPHIANFDDIQPLEEEPGVRVRYAGDAAALGEPDLLILPGTKATMADLAWMRERGLDAAVRALAAGGTAVFGICGGFQVLGSAIHDPGGIESAVPEVAALGLLDAVTRFEAGKVTRQSRATVTANHGLFAGLAGHSFSGYEIHAGLTRVSGEVAFAGEDGEPAGMIDAAGRVAGCYLHGLFHDAGFRAGLLTNVARLRGKPFVPGPGAGPAFDRVADVLEASLDMGAIEGMLEGGPWAG